MKNIKVTLLHHTPLYIASDGARTCWSSQDKSDTDRISSVIGPKDLALIDRVGNQFRHASILEHISMNFFIDGISRACLQELARHRHASLSVKSSRYTLTELKRLAPFKNSFDDLRINTKDEYINKDGILASDYLVMTSCDTVNTNSVYALERLRAALANGISNDICKYCMPEAYRTQLTWTINLRSLQNFISLRTDRKALPEIQHLARLIYAALPADLQSLVSHCVKEQE